MKRILIIVALVMLLGAVALQSQTPTPKPGPEQKKLEIWIGDWTYEGENKTTPLGPAGKFSGKSTVRSILGGFFVEWRGEEKGPNGPLQWAEIDSFDPVNKKYGWNAFGSDGSISVVTYTIEGNTVTYSGTITMGDKPYKMRGIAVFATDFMSFVEKREISIDGRTWMPTFESKSIKSKSAPR